MKLKSLTAAISLLFVCSSVQADDSGDTSTLPEWFQNALTREVTVNASNKINIPELNVADDVLGNFQLAEQDEGFWYFVSEIEGTAPVECYLYTDFDGAANSLSYVIDHELEYIGKTYEQNVTDRSNFGLDIGVIGSTPYIALDTLYNVEVENEKRAGIVKAIAAQTNRSLQVCIQNEIGFKDTFYSLAESFIKAIAKGEDSDAFYEPVYKLSMNGNPVGFARERYSIDADGDILVRRSQSIAIPVDKTSISRTDISATEWSFADGSLINANTYTIVNGEVQSDLSISLADNGWIVEGQLQGKEVKETLAHDKWILSGYGSILETQSLLESENSSEGYEMWIDHVNPGAVTNVTLNKITDDPAANIEFDMGPITMEIYSDDNGIARRVLSNQGNVRINLDIMSVNGTPLQK